MCINLGHPVAAAAAAAAASLQLMLFQAQGHTSVTALAAGEKLLTVFLLQPRRPCCCCCCCCLPATDDGNRAVPQRIISGTSLAAVATTGATAGAVYWSSDCVDARSAAVLAAAAVLTAPFGAKMTHRVDCQVSTAVYVM
jgi:hypothetical protein